MKKLLIGAVVLTAFVGTFVTAGIVYAQTQQPPTQGGTGWGMGGMMRGFGGSMMNGAGMMGGQGGGMHATMISVFAEKLGISAADVNAALAQGKTMWQIAEGQGLSSAEVTTLMQDAHDAALQQAVARGNLTAAQAEWMDKHMEQMLAQPGSASGHCMGSATN
jgi:hypothetical protein